MGNRRFKGAGALALMGLALLGMPACGRTDQGPAFSTETGNPPSIDGTRVALVIEGSTARIVGQPGAVEPLPATVYVLDALSGESSSALADDDGSFDLLAPSAGQTFEVRAAAGTPSGEPSGDRLSDPVVVSRDATEACRCTPTAVTWSHMSLPTALYETRRYTGCYGYNALIYTDDLGTRCIDALSTRCDDPSRPTTTDDFADALEHPDVVAVVEQGGLSLLSPDADPLEGWLITVSPQEGPDVEIRLPTWCANGSECDLASGVQRLLDMFVRVEIDTQVCDCNSPAHYTGDDYLGCQCDKGDEPYTYASVCTAEEISMDCVDGRWAYLGECQHPVSSDLLP